MSQTFVVLDYETYSEADLKKVGAYEYSAHPSTEILCAAWRVGTRETLRTEKTLSWCPRFDKSRVLLSKLIDDLQTPGAILVAHNALFEQVITANVLSRYLPLKTLPPEKWLCTASLAAALALPRNLESAAQVLNLPVQKDMEGRRLILKWCKPKKPSKKDPSTRHSDTDELKRIIQYCRTDIAAEVELLLAAPPLSPTERKVWLLDQKINLRGFSVDRELVQFALEMIDTETTRALERTKEISSGVVRSPKQRDAVLDWLSENNCFLPNLQKKTVDDALALGLAKGPAREMLELRQTVSKSSTAKYQAFEMRSRTDGRIRDNLLYHGASTGRWSGAGVQPQNFPRGTIKNTDLAISLLKEEGLEFLRLVYGEPMEVLSSCLRGVIVAPHGTVLDVADFNAIETRVLFWIAGHDDGVKAFLEGRDLYREQASKIFGVPVDKIQKDSFERFLGKSVVLGAGYAMGPQKFAITCVAQGQEVSEELAKAAIKSYRETHWPIPKLWKNIEKAAHMAVQNLGKKYTINKTSWFVRGDFLWCELPSGRRLAYHKPVVKHEPSQWDKGVKIPVLYHWAVDPKTKRWVEGKTYGGLLVENVVQATARDLMAEAMLRIEAKGPWKIVLTVHDELVAERNLSYDKATNDQFCQLMAETPPWGDGCPVKAEGWSGLRYRK